MDWIGLDWVRSFVRFIVFQRRKRLRLVFSFVKMYFWFSSSLTLLSWLHYNCYRGLSWTSYFVWSVFAVTFSCYIVCVILEQWCIGALTVQINAIWIILYICLRSVIWIGMDLGQHLGHHCGLGWIGSQSWWIGLDWIGFRELDPRPTLVYTIKCYLLGWYRPNADAELYADYTTIIIVSSVIGTAGSIFFIILFLHIR